MADAAHTRARPRPLLFVGDMHLGRSPHRLVAALSATRRDVGQLGPAEAWRRVVRAAKDHGVQAVVLAGDVVDQDKDRFEAWGHLARGVAELLAAGVRVLAVAGNHDAVALPRLAERIPAFELLGRGGRWQRAELEGVDLVGWSFPARHHDGDPLSADGLAEALGALRTDTTHLGVLHTDLDAGRSLYAPTTRLALETTPLRAWFLGHIHQPSDLTLERPIGYLGSLVGLDRGELGPRGPWLVQPGRHLRAQQLAVGPVLWREVEVDVSALTLADVAPATAHDLLHDLLDRAITAAARADRWLAAGDFSVVGCTARLVGRTDAPTTIRAFQAERTAAELRFEGMGCPWVVIRLQDDTQPRWDLAALAEERSPVGQLAQLLLRLDAPSDPEANTDANGGTDAVPEPVRVARAEVSSSLWGTDAPLPDVVESTRREATWLLTQLLAQRGGQGGGRGAAQPTQRRAGRR